MSDALTYLMGNRWTKDAEGEFITVEDSHAVPPVSLNVDGKSEQNGTPTPDAPVPILSVDDLLLVRAGKNLCPTADGSTIATGWTRDGQNFFKYIGLTTDNITLTLSCSMTGVPSTTGSNNRLYVVAGSASKFCDLNTSGAKSVSVSGSGVVYLRVNHYAIDSYGVDELLKDIQLEVGSSATAYTPYTGTTVQNLLPDGYSLRSLPDGTKDELHLTYLRPSDRPGWAWYSRELVKRVSSVDMGDIGWAYSTTYEYFSATLNDAAPAVDREVSTICETYICDANSTINGIRNSMSDKHVRMRNTYKQIFIRDSSYTTSESFTTAVNGVELLYPFAEPETITLDPIELPSMQQGLTNLWSDPSTNLSVTYDRDRNIVISNMKAALDDLATS